MAGFAFRTCQSAVQSVGGVTFLSLCQWHRPGGSGAGASGEPSGTVAAARTSHVVEQHTGQSQRVHGMPRGRAGAFMG